MEVAPIVAVVSLVVALLNFAHTQFQVRAKLDREIGEAKTLAIAHSDKFTTIDDRLEYIEKYINEFHEIIPKVDLFWDIIREHVPKMLLHPDDNVRDLLLTKLSNNTIKHDEAIDLKAILENDLEHMKQHTELLADPHAALLPLALWALEVKLRQTGGNIPNTNTS